ncbi:MAG: LysE family translocator [Burkholderiales bacterium]|nr:LysE family translocator [Zoogloeaceae bacterium]MBV6411698.1 Homoserine/homoserine lactone efflux protein [Rhodocyclaceae bacterium]MCZ2175371.1 LysE family translocator [Burkholderiales bacterium]HNT61879.1 LysE family translocator [Candidatus Desulfobacillus denitrificans]MCQ3923423.1 LysE family translocator [Rhodocyclaceae bacterium]
MTLAQIAGFLAAAALITLAPGPDNLSVLSLGLSRGRRAGIGFGLGCALGCFIHTLLATLGVTALIAASDTAFTLLKLAGAAYLVWLGIGALRSPGATLAADAGAAPADDPMRPYLMRGFVANAINPKVALFFLAFLPQFVDPSRGHAAAQTALLGALFAAQTVLIFGAIGWYAGTLGGWLRNRPAVGRWLDRATGVLFIGLGIRLALAGRN